MRYRIGTWKDHAEIEDCINSTDYYSQVDVSLLDGTFIVAEDKDKQIVGCIWVFHFGRNAYIDFLSVRPALQHSGLGVKLIAKMRRLLKKRGVRFVRGCTILDNVEMVRIWQAFGASIHSPYAIAFVDLGAE